MEIKYISISKTYNINLLTCCFQASLVFKINSLFEILDMALVRQ